MAHTPGPWIPVECDGNADDLAIAVSDGGYVCYSVATHADAELIAAAPEMLAVLRDIIRCAHINTPYGGKAYCISDGRMAAAREAVAKAEGRGD